MREGKYQKAKDKFKEAEPICQFLKSSAKLN